MPPVLATAPIFHSPKTQTLEHCTPLLLRIILFTTPAELVSEILVVFVVRGWFLASRAVLQSSGSVRAQCAWAGLGKTSGSAVADKVALSKELDERVLSMAGYGA